MRYYKDEAWVWSLLAGVVLSAVAALVVTHSEPESVREPVAIEKLLAASLDTIDVAFSARYRCRYCSWEGSAPFMGRHDDGCLYAQAVAELYELTDHQYPRWGEDPWASRIKPDEP